MAIFRKESGSLVRKAGKAIIDLALNRTSNHGIANSVVSNSLMDGIGNTNEVFRFGTDGNGNHGYIKKVGGADTFFPFKSGEEIPEVTIANASGNGYYVYRNSTVNGYNSATITWNTPKFTIQWNGGNGWHYIFKQKTRIAYSSVYNGSNMTGELILNANQDFNCYNGIILVLEFLD